MDPPDELGPVYTRGTTFRARAEARQREYRVRVLGAGWSEQGHWLDESSASRGLNFVVPAAFEEAKLRAAAGKGVDPKRTFSNMLSSQAMCFNVASPLVRDLALATEVFGPFFPGLKEVRSIVFEYTPSNATFGDQTGRGGVDCDLLLDALWADGEAAIITVETKFVEPEFSACKFRAPGRAAKGQAICPDDVGVAADREACGYTRKGYKYWQRTASLSTLNADAVPEAGCPFAGPEWQLWVNHTLAHAEAEARRAKHARFAVCAPLANKALLKNRILERFRDRLANPETFQFIPLDDLLGGIKVATASRARLSGWAAALLARYGGI
jgi:hypothetical protein